MTQSQGSYDDIAALIEAFGGTPGSGGLGELLQTLAMAITNGGGGASISIQLAWNPQPAQGLNALAQPTVTSPFNPTNGDFGPFTLQSTIPAITYASGDIATLSVGAVALSTASVSNDLSISAVLYAFNAAMTEYIKLAASTTIPMGATSGGFSASDFTATTIGADLSWNSGSNELSSAAGGTYAIIYSLSAAWT